MKFPRTIRTISAPLLMLAVLSPPLLLTGCGGGAPNAAPDGSTAAAAAAGTVQHPLAATAPARTYHVDSAAGSDANNGESAAAPWKSLAKLKSLALRDGDAVRLACGSAWREALELSGGGRGVTVGAYGCSGKPQPLLLGARVATGWAPMVPGSKVYALAGVPADIRAVYWNGSTLTPARHPNKSASREFGLLQFATACTDCDAALTLPDRPASGLAGARLVVRTAAWQLASFRIAADAGEVRVGMQKQPPASGQGYLIEATPDMALPDALALLDEPGEWLQHGGTLYLRLPGDAIPSTGIVEYAAPELATGITLNGLPGAQLSDLQLDRHAVTGVRIVNSPAARVQRMQVSRSGQHGIVVDTGSPATVVDDSRVDNAGINGIKIRTSGVSVSGSTITNTGIFGLALAVSGGGAGILVSGSGDTPGQVQLTGNTINDSAYAGISLGGQPGAVINGNLIQRACKRLSDCAGIYAHSAPPASAAASPGSISNNVVRRLQANMEGTLPSQGAPSLVAGIYIDEGNGNFTLQGNAVSDIGQPGDAGVGIQLHKSSFNRVLQNLVWNVSRASLRFHASAADDVRGNTISGNLLYAGQRHEPNPTGGAPVGRGVVAQEWVHQSKPSRLL